MKGTELIDSIRDEMAASKDAYITQMGELMTAYLMRHPETEVAEGKTLKGAFSRLKEELAANCRAALRRIAEQLAAN